MSNDTVSTQFHENVSHMPEIKPIIVFLACLSFTLFVGDDTSYAEAQTPEAFVTQQVEQLLTIINEETERGSQEALQRQSALRTAVRALIDFEELSRRALGTHWDPLSAAQQQQFVTLLRNLIETNYTVKMGQRSLGEDFTVEYGDTLVRLPNALVRGQLSHDQKVTDIELFLLQSDSGWTVYDVVTDDVSLLETYAESFDEIIGDEGWAALIQRLEDRIQSLTEELTSLNNPR